MSTEEYVFDTGHESATEHHRAMADLLDPFTRWRIDSLADWPNINGCLEVGAGHGSIALWLANKVAPYGYVVACDLKPDHIPPHPQLETVAHDLTDSGWPEPLDGPFELIHGRLVLAHLPNPEVVLAMLADRLAPGGMLLLEDWDVAPNAQVHAAPSAAAADLYQRYHTAVQQVLTRAGAQLSWARKMHFVMTRSGQINVETQVYSSVWDITSGLRVVAAHLPQIRPQLLAVGMTPAEVDQLAALAQDPQLIVDGHLLRSTSGFRPLS